MPIPFLLESSNFVYSRNKYFVNICINLGAQPNTKISTYKYLLEVFNFTNLKLFISGSARVISGFSPRKTSVFGFMAIPKSITCGTSIGKCFANLNSK